MAKALGVSNASISMAIKNGKLEPEKDEKLIDIENPVNKIWIHNQEINKGVKFDINKIFDKKVVKAEKPDKKGKDKGKRQPRELTEWEIQEQVLKNNQRQIENERKLADLKKVKLESAKLDLQIKKIQGDVIPFDAVKTVFLYTVEQFRSTYLQEVEAVATIFMERLGGDHKHFVELQKMLAEKINEIQESTKENLMQGIKGIVAEYKEVRNRGELK